MNLHDLAVQYRPLILFVYGQAFFVLGLATAFQFQPSSQFRLANSLWSLSLFGFLHAIAEWGHVFIPIQASFVSPGMMQALLFMRQLLNIASFAFLCHFGLSLIADTWRVNPAIRLMPLVIFAGWLLLLLTEGQFRLSATLVSTLESYEAAGRLLFALPGSILAGTALYLQLGQLSELGLEKLSAPLRVAAGGFVFYAFLSGIVGPPASFFPLSVINTNTFFSTFGIPIEVVRTAIVSLIGISMVRIVSTFNLEAQRRLEVAETQRAILNERLRISRDLHDGVMQSIYGVGLNLESTTYLVDEDPAKAHANLRTAMGRLNETIRDIRNYVLNLRTSPEAREEPYKAVMSEVDRFRQLSPVEVRLQVEDLKRVSLSSEQVAELHQIVREALTNVSRHAKAREVTIRCTLSGSSLELAVTDDGVGFNPEPGTGTRSGQGLANMQARAALLGGTMAIQSEPERGTGVILRMPVEVRQL